MMDYSISCLVLKNFLVKNYNLVHASAGCHGGVVVAPDDPIIGTDPEFDTYWRMNELRRRINWFNTTCMR